MADQGQNQNHSQRSPSRTQGQTGQGGGGEGGRDRSNSTGGDKDRGGGGNSVDREKEREQDKDKELSASQEEKREIVRQLFGDVGDLKRDFSCAVESSILLHGRMYVTKKFLCFYSNLFGLEKKIRVPYSHISVISKENTALVIPNAISITTFRKEYVFRSFWDRDECYNLIKELVEQVKGTRGNTAASHEEANAASIIPSSTSPSPSSSVPTLDTSAPSSSSPQVPSPTTSRPMSTTRQGTSSTSSNSSNSSNSNSNEEYETEDAKRASVRAAAVMENPAEAFALEAERSKLKHETAAVVMTGTIEELFQKFITDDAPLSYLQYQSSTGDKEVEAEPWSAPSSSSALAGCTRDMRFLKPVAIPAKPFARALMIQRYQRFADSGLTIASSTRMEDVPYCDFFTVEVMLCAKSSGDNELTLWTSYEVNFIQSTMFRRFIEGSTNPDVKKWNEDFVNYIKENISDAKKTDSRSRKRSTTKPPAPADTPSPPGPVVVALNSLLDKMGMGPLPSGTPLSSQRASRAAWGCLLLVFLFFGWQWRGVRVELRGLDARLQGGLEAMQSVSAAEQQRGQQWGAERRQHGELTELLQTLQRMRRHSEAVVRVQLSALPEGAGGGGVMSAYEQFLDGSSASSSSSSSADYGAWLASLREQQPLLAEHVITLQGLGQAEEQLQGALSSSLSSTTSASATRDSSGEHMAEAEEQDEKET